MKIFLVEDDVILNDIIVTTFQSYKYDITSFNDGKIALDNISTKYDLYLLDINLPNVNGLEILKKIKETKLDALIFIVSADINIETILNAYDIGCTDFIKKPFDIREVVAKVQKAIENHTIIIPLAHKGIYNVNEKYMLFGKKRIKLTNKEVKLIEILLEYKGKLVSTDIIDSYVWKTDESTGHIRQLVSKINTKLPYKDIIENHTLYGYRLNVKIGFFK
jgi:DNA-binding response OmpR family regulator